MQPGFDHRSAISIAWAQHNYDQAASSEGNVRLWRHHEDLLKQAQTP